MSRGSSNHSNQVQKKVKYNKDIQMPSILTGPQEPRVRFGDQNKGIIKPGQNDSAQRLVGRNTSADIPIPIYLKPKQPTCFNYKSFKLIEPQQTQQKSTSQWSSGRPSQQGMQIPQKPQNKAQELDINAKLHKLLNLPSQYKEVLGDDLEELQQRAKRKERKEKAIQDLIKQGKIQIVKKPKGLEINDKPDPNKKLIMTEEGKLRDQSGGFVKIVDRQTSLKINLTKKKEQKIKDVLKKQKQLKDVINERGKFFDRNLSAGVISQKRQKQKILALNFIEKGSISANIDLRKKYDEIENNKQTDQKENGEKGENMEIENSGNQENQNQSMLLQIFAQFLLKQRGLTTGFRRVAVKMKHYDPIPNIEWWDQDLLPNQQGNYIPIRFQQDKEVQQEQNSNPQIIMEEKQNDTQLNSSNIQNYNKNSSNKQPATAHTNEEIQQNIQFLESYCVSDKDIRLEKITHYIEHPEPFKVSDIVQNRERAVIPTYLTKKEKRRLVKRKRSELEKDKQDRIRLGLQKPDAPKIKLTNMLRILGAEAVVDPSKAEKEVRKQMEQRKDDHDKTNEQRKLTKDQKGEKLRKKWERDAAQEVRMAVFRIEDLSEEALKFKVTMNAHQVGLLGVCLVCNKLTQEAVGHSVPTLIVVEGGPKGIKFYKKLLLNRIKWDQIKSDDPNKVFGCKLIWEGIQKQHAFNKWRVIEMKSEADGRLALAEKGMEHFWDLAMNQQ